MQRRAVRASRGRIVAVGSGAHLRFDAGHAGDASTSHLRRLGIMFPAANPAWCGHQGRKVWYLALWLIKTFPSPAAFGTACGEVTAQVVATVDAEAALAADGTAHGEWAERQHPKNQNVEDRVDGEAGPDGTKQDF